MKKAITFNDGIQRRWSFLRVMLVYLAVCGIGIFVMINSINKLMKEHDKTLTSQMCSVIAEKMNNSIEYMTTSAENMSALLSAQKHDDLAKLYEDMSDLQGDGYVSLGFVGEDGELFATDTEKEEFEKWGLMEIAYEADPVSISAPYRSGLTGEPVFTMFARMTYGSGKSCFLFLTYPLKEIQNIAYTATLADDTEIWLMNAESENIIQCAGSNKYAIGSWANAMLTFEQSMEPADKEAYEEWKESLKLNIPSEAVVYHIGDVSYTQVYSKISFMDGWFLVVRVPSSAMSSAMESFRTIVLVFVSLLLAATMILFLLTHRRDEADRAILENLSVHDPLTEVMNRRAFDMAVQNYLSRPIKPECAMLFIDIDYFKTVNDKYGHDAGDKVLVEFAALLKELFGDNGLISRYGGDEFLVFAINSDKEMVDEKMKILNERAHAIRPVTEKEDDPYHVSCSCGGAMCPDDARSFEELKSCADTALYEVKEKGRDGYGWFVM
ncbi:sensor domain-containing diguanylate cyclase [Ruminococcus sp.]|uniref:sensor domain-containing diguanylate cyclase n=1 Tax=Ruminococcus sp. TaxID=41978 RepID=UPI0025D1FF88|nr:sensor domain-containing diguanylate cyclase [Ruminococcus sp.]MBQ8967457.1 GGDEF domain-containing protein [Ruminococcus sp.]